MKKESISQKQGIMLIMFFIIGETSMQTLGTKAEQNLWVSIVLAIIMVFPAVLAYARLHYLFPKENLYDIIEICFGKIIGKIIVAVFTWYMYDLSITIVRNLGNFVNTVSLVKSHFIVPTIILLILCVWVVKKGRAVIAKWAELFLPILVGGIVIFILMLIPKMDIDNIKPLFYFDNKKDILKSAFIAVTFPFGEVVSCTMFFQNFKREKSPYKVYIIGLLLSGIIILAVSISNLLVLGIDIASNTYYTSYASAARINVYGFFERVEIVMGSILILGGFIKVSITLVATCKGITKIFSFREYKFIATPVAILIINLSNFKFTGINEAKEFGSDIYPYYSFIFAVILPIIIWGVGEIKNKHLLTRNF